MGMLTKLSLFLVILLLLCSCYSLWRSVYEIPTSGRLTGDVTLEVGNGVWRDVEVNLFSLEDSGDLILVKSMRLSDDGLFLIDYQSAGEYYLEVIKPRYDPYFEKIYLDEGGMFLEVELKRYSIPEDVWEVLVVGDFVDWDPLKALPMTDDDGDSLWQVATPLPAGRHSYRYIINGLDEWFIDIKSGEYEPDGFGYYNSVVELEEAQVVTFVLDINDPWFRQVTFEVPAASEEAGWVDWEPKEPWGRQWITIFYDPHGGPLEDAEQIFLHWGVNDWTVPQIIPPGSGEHEDGRAVQTPMEQDIDETWWGVVPTDPEVQSVDFIFTDGQRWDDNKQEQWHVSVRSLSGLDRVIWGPEEPQAGQWITILYDPHDGPLEDAEQIFLHWGVNDWTIPQIVTPGSGEHEEGRAVQTPMERDPDGTWWMAVPTSPDVQSVDFIFTDGQRWDDNNTRGWHALVK